MTWKELIHHKTKQPPNLTKSLSNRCRDFIFLHNPFIKHLCLTIDSKIINLLFLTILFHFLCIPNLLLIPLTAPNWLLVSWFNQLTSAKYLSSPFARIKNPFSSLAVPDFYSSVSSGLSLYFQLLSVLTNHIFHWFKLLLKS